MNLKPSFFKSDNLPSMIQMGIEYIKSNSIQT